MRKRIQRSFNVDEEKYREARALSTEKGIIISRRIDVLLAELIKELSEEDKGNG